MEDLIVNLNTFSTFLLLLSVSPFSFSSCSSTYCILFFSIFFSNDSVIPRVTRHLLSNPVFSCITLAACMEIAVVAGFAAFLGKYLEQQFNLTTSSANQLLGRRLIIIHLRGGQTFCFVL